MNTPQDYIDTVADDKKQAFEKLRETILDNLPEGFEETLSYNMIGYVVPFITYPEGYHADSNLPLPFINIAAQKNHIALYHMGIYAEEDLLKWFTEEYSKRAKTKLDMGKSCIRFKKMDDIPYDLIGELVQKMSPEEWIQLYESQINKKSK